MKSIINNTRDLLKAISNIENEINGINGSIVKLKSAKATITQPTDNQLLTWNEDLSMVEDSLWQLPAADGAANEIIYTDGAGNLGWIAPGAAAVAGADTQVQYNAAGVMGAEAAFTYNYNTNTLTADHYQATIDFTPDAADGASLGTAALEFSDLYLADSSVIYFGNDQDVTLTHIPDQSLALNLSFRLVDTVSAYTGVVYKATDRFIHNYHNTVGAGAVPDGCNFFIGINAGNFTTGSAATSTNHGSYNTGIGEEALLSVTNGFRNFAAGFRSMRSLTTARDNIAIGMESLYTNLVGIYNTAIGYRSLYLATGNYNTGIGVLTMPSLGAGDANNAIGATALYTLTAGSYNIAIGYASLYFLNNNSYNTAIGPWTLYNLNNGNYNFGAGYRVLYTATAAGYNSGAGSQALYLLDTGNYNTSFGTLSTYNLTSGSYNSSFGANAGRYIIGGGNNALCNNSTFVGAGSRPSANNETNQVVIGYNAEGLGSNTTVIGNTSTVTARIYGDVQIDSDTDMLIVGDGQNAGIYYNGTNMVFDSRLVGAGDFYFANGDVGIATNAAGGRLDVAYSGASGFPTVLLGADSGSGNTSRTNNNNKDVRVGSFHYANAEEPVCIYNISNELLVNTLTIGGGTSWLNAVTEIKFYTAANTTTVTGTERMRVESDGQIYAYYNLNIDSNSAGLILGDGQNSEIYYDGSDMIFDSQLVGAGNFIFNNGYLRTDTSRYRRYYHLPLASFDPGASGATWTSATGDHLAGWQLNAAGEVLEFDTDVHSDWDGASDLTVEIRFQLLDAGNPGDTVDLRLVSYYMGDGEVATKTQTDEVATVTDGTQYKMYTVTFTIDYDALGNNVDAGDIISLELNLETDTSEIDNVLIVGGSFFYNTTHTGIESGDT